jgi:arylsulfatase
MNLNAKIRLGLLVALAAVTVASPPAVAQQQQKPNILFIMGDDIGWMQPSVYHRGLMVGETPNIDRIANEGAIFMDYVAMQSCTSGRNAFFTGMYPLRTGMIPPQLPGSPSYLRPGTPALARFLLDLGYNTGEFGKNHLGDHTASLPTAHGFQEYWGYLYHLDAMQQVSFPDINKSPTVQGVAPPCRNTPIPGVPEVPGAVDPKTTICLTPPRPVLLCRSSDGHGEEPDVQGRRAVDARAIEDGGRGDLGQGHRLHGPQRSAATNKAVSSSGTTLPACTSRPCCPTSTMRWSASPAARTGASTKPA